MAEAITIVNGLYNDGFLTKPEGWDFAPDLLQFYNTESSVENELFTMFLEYRQRTFMGAFHANPDYMYWYGFASMQDSLQKIKDEAHALRATKTSAPNESYISYAGLALAILALLAAGWTLFRLYRRSKNP